MRKRGGRIGPRQTVSATNASGFWDLTTQQQERANLNWPRPNTYRYFRYQIGSAISGHHPRVARYVLTLDGVDVTISTATSDNCADSGAVDGPGWGATNITYDAGAGQLKEVTFAKVYSTFNGGLRSANYTVQASNDNSAWITQFSGVMAANSQCGLITGTKV